MTDKNLTEIIDRSGSMGAIVAEQWMVMSIGYTKDIL